MTLRKKRTSQKKTAPVVQEDLPQEDQPVYLTMEGSQCKRLVIAYVNRGEVIEDEDTFEVDVSMAVVLLRRTQVDTRTKEEVNIFRYATEEEEQLLMDSRDLSDPETADIGLLARRARENALNRGDVNPQTEESEQVRKSIEEQRIPRRRRRSATA